MVRVWPAAARPCCPYPLCLAASLPRSVSDANRGVITNSPCTGQFFHRSERRLLTTLAITIAHPLDASAGGNLIAQASVAEHDFYELLPNVFAERTINEIVQRLFMGEHRDPAASYADHATFR